MTPYAPATAMPAPATAVTPPAPPTAPAPFTAQWLQLREPADRAARRAAARSLWTRGRAIAQAARGLDPAAAPLTVFDLGCGTGATLRALARPLGGIQHWHAWDHDAALLGAWPQALAAWARHEGAEVQAEPRAEGSALVVRGRGFTATVQRHRIDLARELETLPFAAAGLVCATALLDLVSQEWLAALIGHLRETSARLSFALVVDGRIEWHPALPGDEMVAAAFAQHQRRDKGFGPALGPHAPEAARRLLEAAGYAVQCARSDWVLRGGALQAAFIDGMARAAREQDPDAAGAIDEWRALRTARAPATRLRVGHVDLFATPAVLAGRA